MSETEQAAPAATEEKTCWGLRVLTRDYSSVAVEADPDTPYDCDSVNYDVTALGVRIDEANPDVIAPFKPVKGEWLYVVCVRKSSGDSFHTDSGIFEAIGAYRNEALARLARCAIEEHNKLGDRLLANPDRLAILNDKEEPVRVSVSWRGYFDSLDSVQVERLRVM